MPHQEHVKRGRVAPGGATAGLTLVELMIAAGLMTLAIVLAFGSLISVSEARRISEGRTIAADRVASVIEEMQGLTAAGVLAYEAPPFTGLGADEQVTVRVFAANGTVVTVPLDSNATQPTLPDPCEVQVLVTWQDRGRTLTQRASTLLSLGG